jgi:signal transduction histidine kinase/CheY-like chemotaxis protein
MMFYKDKNVRVTILQDISERKQAEQTLINSQIQFSKFMEYLPALVFIKNAKSELLYCNDAMDKALGSQKWVNLPLNNIFDEETSKRIISDDQKTLKNGFEVIYESFQNLDGRNRDYETRKFAIPIIGNELLIGGIALDITEQLLAEKEANLARKDAEAANLAKSEFLSRMSHELRTPLNSIMGFAQLLDLNEEDAKRKKGLNHILNSSKHLLNLINEVLDISRIEAGHINVEKVKLNCSDTILELLDIVFPLAVKNGLNIQFIPPANPIPSIFSDPKLLKQILLNLLTNSIKYTPAGGDIKIYVNINSPISSAYQFIRISITDNGIGISPDNLSKIFSPFERIGAEKTGVEGTGLGLSLVKKIIAALGGQVGVNSELGKGSTFWIELPVLSENELLKDELFQSNKLVGDIKDELKFLLADKEERAAELVLLKDELLKNDYKSNAYTLIGSVLIIDDNLSNVEMIQQIINYVFPKVNIEFCLNGKDALDLVSKFIPSMIFLDLNLPDYHGSEILKQIQENEKLNEIPVIIISADATQTQIDKLLNDGATNYLTKPLNLQLLVNIVFSLLSR